MSRVQVPFWSQSAEPRSPVASTERLVNMYLEQAPKGAAYPFVLLPTPGLTEFAVCGDGPVRGMITMSGLLWVVSGNRLYTITPAGVVTDIGNVDGNGPVYLVENGIHIGIGTNATCYAANVGGIVPLPETNFNGASYFDGYGIFSQAGTEKFWITGIDDMTTISGLDFSSADTFADVLMGCINVNRDLLLFGERTVEGWYNSGDARFPFSRSQGAFIEHGCAAPASIAKAENMAIWLGDDRMVWGAAGYQPRPLAQPWVVNIIEQQPDVSSARAFVYAKGGHTFYCLSFSGRTLVLDLTTGLWHERKTSGLDRWRAGCGCRSWSKNMVGDYANGSVYEMDESVYTDDGDEIVRDMISAQTRNAGDRAAMASLQLECDVGVGLDGAVQGSDPEIALSWSDDEGRTWSNEITAKLGKIGERATTVRWNRLGSFRHRSIRLRVSDPVMVAITSAFADIEGRV